MLGMLCNLRIQQSGTHLLDWGVERFRVSILTDIYISDLLLFVYIWQGAVEVPEQQLFFAGDGSAGKTSARKALLSLHGLTEPIHVDDRTVGIDVVRGWRPGGEGSDLEVSLEQIKSKVVKQ